MNNTGQIKKAKQQTNFTIIPNAILEDSRLSLKAIGLLCYILRLPEDWIIHKTNLHKNLKDGRDSVGKAFEELIQCNYVDQEIIRTSGRFYGYNYTVYDTPTEKNPVTEEPFTDIQETAPFTEKPFPVNPITEKPISENPLLISTNNTNNEDHKFTSSKEEVADAGKSKKEKKIKEEKPITLLKICTDQYYDWITQREKMVPKIDGAGINALKSIISYLKTIVRNKNQNSPEPIELTEEVLDAKVLESLTYIFSGWDFLDDFLRNKTRLIDINSQIQTIIKQIRNEYDKKHGVNGTGGTISAINAMYGNTGQQC